MLSLPKAQLIRRLTALVLLTLAATLAGCGGQRAGVSPVSDASIDIPAGVAVESRLVDRGGGV
ncbi:MAG: TlpA family protein disulfide reductase, partial [Roseiflexus sp.]|nr:TlpA family protein disulfide reductase [Roseiflexus sp.]